MSVFLTVLLVETLTRPGHMTAWHAVWLFIEEIAGGAILGIAGGYALLWLLRRLPVQLPIYPVLAITTVLVMFGGAQTLGASGFMAVYLMGVIVGIHRFEAHKALVYASEAFAWLAQMTLFLLLGLLVTPHNLRPFVGPILITTTVLLVLARPMATFVSLLPFGYSARDITFASWVGLRGAVPIYLTIIPVLAGVPKGDLLFGAVFGVVLASLLLQGWTISPVARVLGYGRMTE